MTAFFSILILSEFQVLLPCLVLCPLPVSRLAGILAVTLQSTTFKSEEKETLKANTDVKLDFSIDEGSSANIVPGFISRKKSEVCTDKRTCNTHQSYIHCEIIT